MASKRSAERTIRSFIMTNQMLLADLRAIEQRFGLTRLVEADEDIENANALYMQFESKIREEANWMAENYRLFYCLERSIRELISSLLEAEHGPEWWDAPKIVPDQIKATVRTNKKRELDSGITPRSSEDIDYTNFGELSEIIKTNWNVFGAVFNSTKAVEKVLSTLNTLRNPIAHCSMLAEDEALRLQLGMRDWFRILSSVDSAI